MYLEKEEEDVKEKCIAIINKRHPKVDVNTLYAQIMIDSKGDHTPFVLDQDDIEVDWTAIEVAYQSALKKYAEALDPNETDMFGKKFEEIVEQAVIDEFFTQLKQSVKEHVLE